jgi:hypothetical protein
MEKLLKAKMILSHGVEDRDGMLKSEMEEGVVEIHDRLAELLAKYEAKRKAA